MRDYRGKSIKNEGWVYGYYAKCSLNDNAYIITEFDETPLDNAPNTCIAYQVIPESIGQYTGLKDKSGKEIYEGDILQVYIPMDEKVDKFKVYWNEEQLNYFAQRLEQPAIFQSMNNYPLCAFTTLKTIEIIGNIYENKELVK